ncbi:chlororespiratory reduction protein 7 [Pantanalinema sp. GBBB05]|uniref:chlororespiratory reduction protein 7 n=1 Tax=Pantanalinema sp. GBBB05 TaxID=2604139 RepID=UPI003D81C004
MPQSQGRSETIEAIARCLRHPEMVDPRLYESDTFVVLEPGQAEQFLSTAEMLDKLKGILAERQDDLPRELQQFTAIDKQAQYLLDTSCEFDVAPGQFLQWYAVRLEK